MPISRRYSPEHPPGESCLFGFDFSPLIPPGVGIASGTLDIQTNTVPPVEANGDWTVGAVQVRDRTLYATLAGGQSGTDYLLIWVATDTNGNIWPRTGAVLCAPTS
jgi:hypothetical protein